jgi:hypothetical protein
MDCDEIIDQRRSKIFLDRLTPDLEHVAVGLTQYQYWINARGKGLQLWRVFRSDLPYRSIVKGYPRKATAGRVGWHFTNCYTPEEIRIKALGILTHYGFRGVDAVPSVEDIERSLRAGKDPFRTRWSSGKLVTTPDQEIFPPEHRIEPNLDHAPKFMRDNPDLFPVYIN